MSLAYFPLFPTDFDADTGHLTFAEDGAYNRLLRLSWRCVEAKMPDDLDWICRKARATTPEDRALIEAVLVEFFTRKGGWVWSPLLVGWIDQKRRTDPRPWVPLAVQRLVYERDGKVCAYCKDTVGPFHLDHVHPWALGGSNDPDNLTVCCSSCNWSKGSKTLSEWRGY